MNGGTVRGRREARPPEDGPGAPRRLIPLERTEALRLLAGVPLGRVVFTQHALPVVRPVSHLVTDDAIIIRTHEGAALTAVTAGAGAPGTVVAYEADAIDPEARLGWSVVVTGYARLVTEPGELERYQALLRPWVNGAMDYAVRIAPELVTGFRLTESDRWRD